MPTITYFLIVQITDRFKNLNETNMVTNELMVILSEIIFIGLVLRKIFIGILSSFLHYISNFITRLIESRAKPL